MAGLFSHLIAGKTLLTRIDGKYKDVVSNNLQAYYLGTQGPDLFFYYYTRVFYRSTRPLGQALHKERVGKFISELIYHTKHIKNEKQRGVATAYLLGYICHYVVDAHTHPYIYFNAGFSKNKKFKLSPLNSLYHRIIEDNIDEILLDYFYENALDHHESGSWELINRKKFKQVNEYFRMSKEDIKTISILLATSIEKTYDSNIDSGRIESAMKQMNMTLTFLEASSKRHKKLIILEDQVQFNEVNLERLKAIQEKRTDKDYFNFAHSTWSAPWDLDIKSNDSFYEMGDNAVNECVEIANMLFKYFDDKITFDDLMESVKNRSLAHGSDCVEDIAFKYHDVIFKRNDNKQ